MLDAFLVPEKTVVTAKGDSEALDVSTASNPVFLLTLSIHEVVEQESIEITLFTSADGTTWEAKPVATLPQKFYVGEYPLLVDLTAVAEREVCSRALGRKPLGSRSDDAQVRMRRAYSRGVAGSPAGRQGRGEHSPLILMHDTRSVTIHPARNILGSVGVPGDKSISHRYAMLAALAAGRSQFKNFSPGADCASTLGCVRALGCNVERDEAGNSHDRRDSARNCGRPPRLWIAATPARPCGCCQGIVAGQSLHLGTDRRRVTLASADAPDHRALDPDGRRDSFRRRWLCAAAHHRCPPAWHRVSRSGRQRSGQDVVAVCRIAR